MTKMWLAFSAATTIASNIKNLNKKILFSKKFFEPKRLENRNLTIERWGKRRQMGKHLSSNISQYAWITPCKTHGGSGGNCQWGFVRQWYMPPAQVWLEISTKSGEERSQ